MFEPRRHLISRYHTVADFEPKKSKSKRQPFAHIDENDNNNTDNLPAQPPSPDSFSSHSLAPSPSPPMWSSVGAPGTPQEGTPNHQTASGETAATFHYASAPPTSPVAADEPSRQHDADIRVQPCSQLPVSAASTADSASEQHLMHTSASQTLASQRSTTSASLHPSSATSAATAAASELPSNVHEDAPEGAVGGGGEGDSLPPTGSASPTQLERAKELAVLGVTKGFCKEYIQRKKNHHALNT